MQLLDPKFYELFEYTRPIWAHPLSDSNKLWGFMGRYYCENLLDFA